MAHPLEAWRIEEGIGSKAEAARLLGMTPGQYGDIVAGRTYPSAARIREIVHQTGRRELADALVMWEAA